MYNQEQAPYALHAAGSTTITIRHPRFIALMMGFCTITLLRVALSINIPVIIYIAYAVILSALITKEEQIAFICSQIAFTSFLQYRYVLLISILFLLVKKRKRKYHYRYMVPLLLMVIWELLHAHISGLQLYGFLQEFAELLTLTVILIDEPNDYADGLPFRTLGYSAIFALIMDVIASIKLYGFSFTSLGRLGDSSVNAGVSIGDFQGVINPNEAGVMCLMAIGGLLLVQQLDTPKLADRAATIVLLIFALLTQSRSALLCIFLMIILYTVINDHQGYIAKNKLMISIIAMAVVPLILCVFFGDYLLAFLERFGEADISHGRAAIFNFYHMHLLSRSLYWIFGIGLYRYNSTITKLYGDLWKDYPGLGRYADEKWTIIYKVSHNSIQEVLVVWGIIGLLLVIMLLFMMFRHKKMHLSKHNYILPGILFLYSLFGQVLSSGIMLLGMIFILICLEYNPGKRDCTVSVGKALQDRRMEQKNESV